jgi:uncharacterized protein YecA (UPF0149 family)
MEDSTYIYRNPHPRIYKPRTYKRKTPKVGRNELCPCGSGKKFKHCCLAKKG